MALKCEIDMGETRMIQIGIHNIHGEPFNIMSAEYELTEKYTGDIVGTGHEMRCTQRLEGSNVRSLFVVKQ